MWRRKKHYSVMGMDMDWENVDIKKVATVVVAGIAAYKAAQYMFREMMD
ncbi:hypothetical protein HSX37_13115|uniref:Uncharacterized protein n=1 Tax=Dendrosporobacter quercicolus TaxID=146817 RepID=A0A1G9Z663_9FIRM|nr:hypothetical protein [Dendrosporobacter quercicolus]NSL48974.1 hypothetical protein [Dendrosporobacter quercicolus DSM 1736]SDN16291.1 hypothetical protein SAMN04488502_11339 [Dendrosporobacter quercicolus]